MAEVVFRPQRGVWLVFTAAFGWFFVGSLAMAFPDALSPIVTIWGIKRVPGDDPTVIGLVLAAAFGFFVVLGLVRLFAPALRLTSEALVIGRYRLAWTDVDDFERRYRRIKVLYAPWHELNRSEKRSLALGKVGLYFPPTYLYATYGTNVQQLLDALRRHRLTYGR
jgi:hypothetical protein